MKEIELTQGKIGLVDGEDFELVNQYKWHLNRHASRKIKAVMRKVRYSDGIERNLYLHRLIMGLQFSDKRIIDHINGNPLDNRRANLRLCNNSENSCNRGATSHNTSGYNNTPELASEAYIKAVHKYHGKFAKSSS